MVSRFSRVQPGSAGAADAGAALTGTAAWPAPALSWCRVEGGEAEVMTRPPRGLRLGRGAVVCTVVNAAPGGAAVAMSGGRPSPDRAQASTRGGRGCASGGRAAGGGRGGGAVVAPRRGGGRIGGAWVGRSGCGGGAAARRAGAAGGAGAAWRGGRAGASLSCPGAVSRSPAGHWLDERDLSVRPPVVMHALRHPGGLVITRSPAD